MTPFLKQVAQRYYSDGNMSSKCFIFPSRRSLKFFTKYLKEIIHDDPLARPMVMPVMYTARDFYYEINPYLMADRVTLLVELYKCYSALNPQSESLDDFIFWGDVLLADFNDIDKYLVDPKQLLRNISDLKSIKDDFSYLNEEQEAAITKFIGHFTTTGKIKTAFLQIWNILEELYNNFNSSLREKGFAYEGMIYRSVVDSLEKRPIVDTLKAAFPQTDHYVFVGLNALNECEKVIMRKMRDAGIADFCWDYSGEYITHPKNKSSFFMKDNIREFPQSIQFEDLSAHKPEVNVISVPSSVGQVKVLPEILKNTLCVSDPVTPSPESTAIITPDENLLIPLLNSIPSEIREVNVTMGRTMQTGVFYSFVIQLAILQLYIRQGAKGTSFYHRPVWALFSNGVFAQVASEQTKAKVDAIKKAAKIYIPVEDFKGDELLELIFSPIVTDPNEQSAEQIQALADYFKKVIYNIGRTLSKGAKEDEPTHNMLLSFAREAYRYVNLLSNKQLAVKPRTWFALLDRIIAPAAVPFNGEPLKGLQVMGPLETRALDFDNLIVLSCNEGIFPSHNVSSSFIPPELRKAFALPTYEYQDAIWAYYFYRMICRAKNVWLIYDSRSGNNSTGEQSRYIRQLQKHFKCPMNFHVVSAPISAKPVPQTIAKGETAVEKIRKMKFSASAIKTYLTCSMKFYYSYVERLSTDDEVTEILDKSMFGTIYHAVMQHLLSGEEYMAIDTPEHIDKKDQYAPITIDYLKHWSKQEDHIKQKVKKLICDKLHTDELEGRNIISADIITKYVMKTIQRDIEFLSTRANKQFNIVGLEKKYDIDFEGYKIKGFIDRLDSYENGTLRVCDYKTGKVNECDRDIDNDNAYKRAEDVATKASKKDEWPSVAFQMFIYDLMLRKTGCEDKIFNAVYIPLELFKNQVVTQELNEMFYEAMKTQLKKILDDISNPELPFTMAKKDEYGPCSYCDFKKLCIR